MSTTASSSTSPWNGTNSALNLNGSSGPGIGHSPYSFSAPNNHGQYNPAQTDSQEQSRDYPQRAATPPLLSSFPPLTSSESYNKPKSRSSRVAPPAVLENDIGSDMPSVPSSSSASTSASGNQRSQHRSLGPSSGPATQLASSGSLGSIAGSLGLGTARNMSAGPTSLGYGAQGQGQARSVSASASVGGGGASSGLNTTAAVYHPYKRQMSAKNLKDKERKGRGTPSPIPPPPLPLVASAPPAESTFVGGQANDDHRHENVNANLGGALPPFPTTQPDSQAGYQHQLPTLSTTSTQANQQPYPYLSDGTRTPSHDSIGTISATRPNASSLPPGAAPPVFPGSSYGRSGSSSSSVIGGNSGMGMTRSSSGRQRANSTGSTSSIGSHGTVGVAMRAGRGAVPLVLGGGGSAPGSGTGEGSFRIGDKVFNEKEEVGHGGNGDDERGVRSGHAQSVSLASYNPADAFEDAPSPARPSHRRQSSSTSSVGQVIRPTIGGNPSFVSSSPSTVTPVTVLADMRSHSVATSPSPSPAAGIASKTLPPAPVSPTWKSEKPQEKEKEKEKKSGGLKGRLQKALKKDTSEKEKERSVTPSASARTPPRPSPITTPNQNRQPQNDLPVPSPSHAGMISSTSAPAMIQRTPPPNHQSNDSESSGQSSAQPKTPPEAGPASYPHLGNRRPSTSSFAPSMVEPLNGGQGKPKRSLFNMKNASTDNISISSTVSSASMMIRRMGALGKLARRNSLAGISKIFKDKNKDDDDLDPPAESTKKSKRDKKSLFGAKSNPASSSTSYATADAERSFDEDRALVGLSPAAQLARQHTLRSKAEDARSSNPGTDSASVSSRGTATAGQLATPVNPGYNEAGAGSDEDSDLEEAGYSREIENAGPRGPSAGFQDPNVRASMASAETADLGAEYGWGQTYRDRHAIPERGILKASQSYNGRDAHRKLAKANSVDFASQEVGPLSKLQAKTFDNIDGASPVERENDPSLAGAVSYDPFSPSFSPFDNNADREPLADRLNMPYSNASLNTSAPVLSKAAPGKAMRSTTSPLGSRKNLNWAPECAVYHTFHSSEYDRRSGPATCNSLTPQIAQQIKDELNGYKMEEMDVHPSSRIHTHFFI